MYYILYADCRTVLAVCNVSTCRYLGIVNCMLHAGAGDELECLDSRLLSCAAGDLAGLAVHRSLCCDNVVV